MIKLLTFNEELTWDTFRLFEREAGTLQSLTHPAIPRYLDYFEVETNGGKGFALVQSYIDADSLEAQLKSGRSFSGSDLKQLATAILDVLKYLHSRSPAIIHRDLKPSNILLADRSGHQVGHIYLVDFGSVQAAQSEDGTRTVVGTYGYMPPDQFGDRAVAASDLYGLGTTLIALASGQNPADLPQKNMRICFEDQVGLTPAFIAWIRWLTEPALDQRANSAEQALEALKQENFGLKSRSDPSESLSVLSKPAGSRIKLIKQSDLLEIVIPPSGFTLALIPTIGFAIAWNTFLVIWYSTALSSFSYIGLGLALFALGHLAIGIRLIFKILFTLFGHLSLRLDSDKIALTYRLFDRSLQWPRPVPQSQISRIELTKHMTIGGQGRSYGSSRQIIPAQIYIWAGNKKFNIGNNLAASGSISLSDPELNWLANELSNWLDLPIS